MSKTLEEVHKSLQQAFDILAVMYGNIPPMSTDTAFALGEATGLIAKAKALVGRDIDDARKLAQPSNGGLSQLENSVRTLASKDLFARRREEEPNV
jgi:hypothetical protein